MHIPTLGEYVRTPKSERYINSVFRKNEREPTIEKMRKALVSDTRPTTTEQLASMVFKSGGYVRRLMSENADLQVIMRNNYKAARLAEMQRIKAVYDSRPPGVRMKDWAAKHGTSVPMLYKARDYVRYVTGQTR